MIAEEYNIIHNPNVTVPRGTSIIYILTILKNAFPFFKTIINNQNLSKPLNENKLTQILVEQLDVQLRKSSVQIGVKNQYSDLFFGIKGIPDFYFHMLEEGRTSLPLFVVEAKRLPATVNSIETEYVIGANNNGGIERFKSGKHGEGILGAGLVAFIELHDTSHWLSKVNTWIVDLSKINTDWHEDEILTSKESESDFMRSESLVHRVNMVDLKLNHFWIAQLSNS